MNEYKKLTNIVKDNLKKHTQKGISFELYDNLFENIYNFPVEKLLNIKSDDIFIHEVYFKLLNRPVDTPTLQHHLNSLQKNKVTRQKIIDSVYNSDERKIKKTNITLKDKVRI